MDDIGDGTIGCMAGADSRMGREAQDEYDEKIAPKDADECVLSGSNSTIMVHNHAHDGSQISER